MLHHMVRRRGKSTVEDTCTLQYAAAMWRISYRRLLYEVNQRGIVRVCTHNGQDIYDANDVGPVLCDLFNSGVAKGPELHIPVPADNVMVTTAGKGKRSR